VQQWYLVTVVGVVVVVAIGAALYLIARRSTRWRVDVLVQIERNDTTTERAAGDRSP